ncbi:DUF1684 domain-containing protein [Actinoplanes sp. NPDC051851]|uniref:DUF1684 domain-containing protein n=1 Tax=Actinoplanes sp. NPDC051851 TaxID=3154753 RepID=UPI00342DD262
MEALELADYRARVARMYQDATDLEDFRKRRDELFARHPQAPVKGGLRYFPENPDAIVEARVRAAEGELSIDTGGPDGVIAYRRTGILETPFGELTLWWIAAYGGGLFLPVQDTTCGDESYGGGRYLTDTVKGTHGRGLEWLGGDRVRLDFNYLYNPSCAYDDRWACPLAPPENRLGVPLRAGELTYR